MKNPFLKLLLTINVILVFKKKDIFNPKCN